MRFNNRNALADRGRTIDLLPIEVGRLADPRLAADVRHGNAVCVLLQNERLLRLRIWMPSSSFAPPSHGRLRRKTLTPSDPVFRDQITSPGSISTSVAHVAGTPSGRPSCGIANPLIYLVRPQASGFIGLAAENRISIG